MESTNSIKAAPNQQFEWLSSHAEKTQGLRHVLLTHASEKRVLRQRLTCATLAAITLRGGNRNAEVARHATVRGAGWRSDEARSLSFNSNVAWFLGATSKLQLRFGNLFQLAALLILLQPLHSSMNRMLHGSTPTHAVDRLE